MVTNLFKKLFLYKKRIIKILLALLFGYLLLFTILWVVFIDLIVIGLTVIEGMVTLQTENVPQSVVLKNPINRAVCDFGNWVTDMTKGPVISDAVMIANWEKNHKHWEEMIKRIDQETSQKGYTSQTIFMAAIPAEIRPATNQFDHDARDRYLASIGLSDFGYDARLFNPERKAFLNTAPELRKNELFRPCIKNLRKSYLYFPDKQPLVNSRGELYRESSDKDMRELGIYGWGDTGFARLVSNTDKSYYTETTARKITPQWYINRHD